jgi:hypothetical protein
MSLTWEEVMAREEDLVGGDLEAVEGGIVLRGPLERMYIEDGLACFETEWLARLDGNEWRKESDSGNRYSVNVVYSSPSDVGDGRVFFVIPYIGQVTLFSKGGSKLDPQKVIGL